MTAAITDRDETAEIAKYRYRYTRVVETAGRVVRVRIERGFRPSQCHAVAEVLADTMTWTHLAREVPINWIDDTQPPSLMIHAATELGPLADHLVRRAAEILAPPTTPSRRVLDAVSALLATSHGYNGERRIDPDEIDWAKTYGGALHVIEHPDGSVTFTKEHRDDCPFITSSGLQDCDDECVFEHPADAKRRLEQ